MYTIDEAFEILSKNKLTSHKETVRNWVRKGVIKQNRSSRVRKVIESVRRPSNSSSKNGCLKDGSCTRSR